MGGRGVPMMGTFGDGGWGGRWQRCHRDGDPYGMEGMEVGGRDVPTIGTGHVGGEGSRTVL